ncbi:MAG: response regulator [Deltaproteobacteria bacterium]|nr:response regulator [Deltaproteobacteria bacterium]
MMHKSVSLITGVLLTIAFCTFIMIYEKRAMTTAQSRIDTHARIIEDAMWNYNQQGVQEYLKLAAFSDHYESLTVTHHNGDPFQEIHREPATGLDRLLMAVHLMPRVQLNAQVYHQGNIIGRMEAVWVPETIYMHAYVFFALVMVFVIMQLYLRLLKSNTRLEERVKVRTAELMASNLELKQEIEERARAEEALRTSEQKHRLLSENIHDIIWTMDLDLNYTYISPAATKVQGWEPVDLKTMTLERSITPASFEKASQIFAEQLTMGERTGDYGRSTTMELELYRKDGSTVMSEVTASFLVGEDGRPTGILGVTRDITERRRAEKEKAALRRQLERSKKMESLGLLAGGVAHDLNNVLSGIVSYPDLLLMDLPVDDAMRAPIETIKESGQKAATIVQDLLTLARRGVSTSEVLNLNSLIEDQLRSAEHQKLLTYYPDIRFSLKLEADLPNIKGSSVHLNKTIMNLVSNAAEAQPNGGEIIVTTESVYMDQAIRGYDTVKAGEYVRLRVKDEGEGISETDLNHIFEPFYTKKKMGRSGTGLGLAVVWGTVQDHDGYIDVHSIQGEGTVFDLYFPLSRDAVEKKDPRINLAAIQGSGETILVVDDMESQRKIASHLLQRLNYTAHTADSGEAAIAYLKDHTVDLVILDMIMDPGMDGLDTWCRIIELHPKQRAIIASGYAETDKVRTVQRLGAGEYLKKPYMIDSLGKAVKKALAGAHSG